MSIHRVRTYTPDQLRDRSIKAVARDLKNRGHRIVYIYSNPKHGEETVIVAMDDRRREMNTIVVRRSDESHHVNANTRKDLVKLAKDVVARDGLGQLTIKVGQVALVSNPQSLTPSVTFPDPGTLVSEPSIPLAREKGLSNQTSVFYEGYVTGEQPNFDVTEEWYKEKWICSTCWMDKSDDGSCFCDPVEKQA